jgi:hypothetical protein
MLLLCVIVNLSYLLIGLLLGMVDSCYGESCDVDGAHCAPGLYHLSKFFYYLCLLKADFTGLGPGVFRFTDLTGNPPVTRQP